VAEDKSIEEILDTIGDQHARRVLAAISREPQSAKELAEECNLSLPTVYRRIELLDEYDLVTDHTLVAEDGNHYKVYESNFESTVISLELISFQAYRKRPSERLQFAFVGFAFISMGVAVSSVITQLGAAEATALARVFFQMAETIPFIIGFAMLYVSLYR